MLLAIFLASCAAPTPAPYNPQPTFTRLPPEPTPTRRALFPTLSVPETGTSGATSSGGTLSSDPLPTFTSAPFLNLEPTLTARALEPTTTPFVPSVVLAVPAQDRTPLPPSPLSGNNWALVPSAQGLWAMRADGSNARLLVNDPILRMATSPGGTMVAYLSHPDPLVDPAIQPYGYTLKLLTLFNGQVYTVASIDALGASENVSPGQLDNAYQAISAYDRGGMTWSPNGSVLAFVSGMEGPASDVYLYYPSSARITRLTDLAAWAEPAGELAPHAYSLDWSPDGTRLFVAAAYHFGGGQGTWMAGAWLVERDGRANRVAGGDFTGERLLAWAGSANVVLSSASEMCNQMNLRTYTLSTRSSIELFPGCFDDYLYDRYRQEILISVTEPLAYEESPAGLYLGQVTRSLRPIASHGYERLIRGDSATPWFGFNEFEGLFGIRRNGQVTPIFTGPEFTELNNRLRPMMRWPDVRSWLFTAEDGLYLARLGQPLVQLFDQRPQGIWTAPGGARLYFSAYQDEHLYLFSITPNDLTPVLVNEAVTEPVRVDWR